MLNPTVYKTVFIALQALEHVVSDTGGLKFGSLVISGSGAFSRLGHEAGVHRVQRVPATETQGRIHTSTASVVVMSEADEVSTLS
jgi:peptide chain release factor 1